MGSHGRPLQKKKAEPRSAFDVFSNVRMSSETTAHPAYSQQVHIRS
jgi:hypothetical protein